MGRSLEYEIPGDDPRVSPDEVASCGWVAQQPRRSAPIDVEAPFS
jgi:hypothetical protein